MSKAAPKPRFAPDLTDDFRPTVVQPPVTPHLLDQDIQALRRLLRGKKKERPCH